MLTEHFLDQANIEAATGITFGVNRPTKYAGNPISAGWESNNWDPEKVGVSYVRKVDDIIKMWIMAYDYDVGTGYQNTYQESTDGGIIFIKPRLGLVNWGGSTSNNLYLGDTYQITGIDFDEDNDRYVATADVWPGYGIGLFVATISRADWESTSPIKKNNWALQKAISYNNNPFYTEASTLWKRPDGRWIVYAQAGHTAELRSTHAWLSDTVNLSGTWTYQGAVISAVSQSNQKYCLGVHELTSSLLLGFVSTYNKSTELMDRIELWVSRNGLDWILVDSQWLTTGLTWDSELILSYNSFIELEDEDRFYYSGGSEDHATYPRYSSIGFASLPSGRLGKATVTGGVGIREIISTPQDNPAGEAVLLKATSTANNRVRVGLVDENNVVIPGYSKEECILYAKDANTYEVHWGGKAPPTTGSFKIIYELENGAALYGAVPGVASQFVSPEIPVDSTIFSDASIFGVQSFGGFGFGQLDGYPADYEFTPIATDELIVYASNGAPAAILDAATDVCLTRELFGLEELTFSLSPTDAKYAEIKHLRRVSLDGRSYIIDRTGDERDETLSGKVVAVSLATHELGKIKNYGLDIETLTAAGGAASILLGSGWTVRAVSDTTKRRSYKPSAGETVLSNLLAWADICNLYPVFDSQTREIDLVASPGASNGVEIRVGKNARGIKREVDSGNVITRLYVYGKDDLSIAEANPTGLPYIDNFSHFIESEGVTEEAIYADIATNGKASRYLAEGEWRDNRYTDVTSLFMDAVVKLEEACRPKASYSAKVIDLARLVGSGYEHEAFALGDTLRLIDEELGIDTLQYVVREKRYPFEPERDEVELANKRLSVVDALTRAARVIEMVDRRGGAWEDSADRVAANFDAWMRAHSLNEDGTIPIDLLRGIWYAANSAIRAGLNESVIIDNNGITIAEHTVVEDYNVNGSFGSVGFGEIAFGGYAGTVQLNWKTDRYIRMTGGAIVMCAGEGLPIRTAITPDGILAPALIIDNDNPLTPDGNAVIIDERGISVFHNNDPENQGFIRIGGGVIESWNFDDVAKTGFKISAATGAIIAHSLVLDGYIEIGDIIDTSDNAISSDGLTNYGGTRILINNAGFFAFKNGAYKIQLDAINDVYRFSGELFAGSINTLSDCHIGTDAYLGKNTGNLRSLWLNSAHSVRIHNSGSGANLSLAGTGTFTVAVDDFINLKGNNYFNANIGSDYGGILFGWQGIVGIYYNGVYAAQASVSFGTSFQTTPHIQATVTESSDVYGIGVAKFNAAVHSVTAAGCTIATRDILQVGLTGYVNVFVQAAQCKPI